MLAEDGGDDQEGRPSEAFVAAWQAIACRPLGQTEAFARDFYDMIARAVAEGPPA